MIERFKALADKLLQIAGVTVELMPFPSGAVFLDVWRGRRFFVLAYSPQWNGFGLDDTSLDTEVDDGWTNNFDFWFKEFEPAAEHLIRRVESANDDSARIVSTPPLLDLPSVHTPLDSTPDRS